MKYGYEKKAFSLVEVLVTVGIIAVLAAGLLSITSRISNQAKTRLTKSTIEIVVSAVEVYYDNTGRMPLTVPDTGLDKTYFENLLQDRFGYTVLGYVPIDWPKDNYAPNEVLYLILDKHHQTRKLIGSISDIMIDNYDIYGNEMMVFIQEPSGTVSHQSLVRFLDAWQMPLRYYCPNDQTFPVITSAGPDKTFDTNDDISSM